MIVNILYRIDKYSYIDNIFVLYYRYIAYIYIYI